MAIDLERLVVQLSADMKKYESTMKRALGVTNKSMGAIQKKADSTSGAIGASFARAGVAMAAAFVTGSAVQGMKNLSEAATRIDNALKVAGLSGAELEKVYQSLASAAKANGAPIESLVTLYGRAAIVQKELGVSTEELLGFTNNVAVALRVAGTDAQSASGALLQLSQALGSGTVRAEEFNSILEGALPIAQAAAAGLKEAGGSVAKLRGLVIDGKISSEAFFRAFEAGAVTLEAKAAKATFTVAQATTNLYTALIDVAREFNNSTGASERFASGINAAANAISDFDVSGFISKIREAKAELDGFLNALGNADIFKQFNEMIGVTKDGLVVNVDKTAADAEVQALEAEVKLLQERIALNTNLGFDNTEALARLNEVGAALSKLRAAAANLPTTVDGLKIGPNGLETITGDTNGLMGGPTTRGGLRHPVAVAPVSLTDYAAPAGTSTAKGKGAAAAKQNDYQQEIAQIRERTAALRAETAAQATVNPLIEDYGYAMEKAKAEQELLSSAQKAGVAITADVKAEISTLASGYAAASAAAKQLAAEQDKVRETMDFAKDAANGFLSDLRTGLEDGKLTWQEFGTAALNVLNKIIDKIQGQLIDALFEMGSSSGSSGLGGLLGALFGGAASAGGSSGGSSFDSGGYTGHGGKHQPAGIVHKGEYVFDAEATKRIGVNNLRKLQGYASGGLVGAPSLPSVRGGGGGGGGTMSSTMHITVGGTGDKELIANLTAAGRAAMKHELTRFSKEALPRRVTEIARDPRKVG